MDIGPFTMRNIWVLEFGEILIYGIQIDSN